jgi:transcriptional regulator with XRE-family HTH domain
VVGNHRAVDDVRLGRLVRALRLRKGFRQLDVARSAGVSQSLVSLAERGHITSLSVRSVRAICAAVEARYEGLLTWRGGAIDRLLDERHARLVGSVSRRLEAAGWRIDVEVTFNEYGDRGSIDVLATRPADSAALVVEVKTELTAIDDAIRRLDTKERLAARIVLDRFGWRPASVGRLIVLLEASTNRRRVSAHDAVLAVALPARGAAVARWLRHPTGRLSGLLISSPMNQRGPRRESCAPRRVDGLDSQSRTIVGGM